MPGVGRCDLEREGRAWRCFLGSRGLCARGCCINRGGPHYYFFCMAKIIGGCRQGHSALNPVFSRCCRG